MPCVFTPALSRAVCVFFTLLGLFGCQKKPLSDTPSVQAPKFSATVESARPLPVLAPPLPGERSEIAAGRFFAGSLPGDAGRKPLLEPRRFEVELGPFQMDRLPYPNQPGEAPRTQVSREEARRLCAEQSARLCTELEWERACKGNQSWPFLNGNNWSPACSQTVLSCASNFGVFGLGTTLREWVQGETLAKDGTTRLGIVRGAPAGGTATDHRCATRGALDPQTRANDLGFRCCHGAPNAATIPENKLAAAFEKSKIAAEKLERLFSQNEATAALKDLKFFREPDAANTVVTRGPGDRKGFLFTVAPLLWNPAPGVKILLVSGRSNDSTTFVAAFHVLGTDDYLLAASFIMKNEPGPVAFAYSESIRPRVHFSSCWGCPGETGKILFRDPENVAILQP